MSERIEMERLLQEQTAWKIERDELRQENADLTEKINQLEVLAGELLKELKFMQAELIFPVGSFSLIKQGHCTGGLSS